MLSLTDGQGKTPYSWKITPRSGPGPLIGLPSNVTAPADGCMNPATMFNIVVLPQPDGPMTETNSRSQISYVTSFTTRISPPPGVAKQTETFLNSIRVCADIRRCAPASSR